MKVHTLRPSPPLQDFVRHYTFRDTAVLYTTIRRPLLARADPFLAIHLRDPYEVFEHAPGRVRLLPPSYIVGPQTRRVADLLLHGHLRVFVVSFRPTGLHRLLGLPLTELTDRALDAADLFGPACTTLRPRLLECPDVAAMVRLVEETLLLPLASAAARLHPIEHAATAILDTHGQASLERLAAESGVGERQFARSFAEQIGVNPKRYARIARVTYAVGLKEAEPGLTWASISQRAGYFDQMHLNRDFKDLAGASPTRFFDAVAQSATVFPASGRAGGTSVSY
jgi:AraC-like DNA-binding protein